MPAELPEIIENLMEIARVEAYGARAEAIEPVHLFIAVCKQCIPPIQRALESLDRDPTRLRRRVRRFAQSFGNKIEGKPRRVSSRVLGIVNTAKVLADAEQHLLSPCEVLRVLIRNPDRDLAAVIKGEEIPVDKLDEVLRREGANLQPAELTLSRSKPRSIIDEFGKDYTAMAREGKIDPVIGRRQEIKQIVRVLLRKQKNNPVLVGDPGVGKTSLVEGLALLATTESAPPELRRMRIVEIQIASLVAGTRYRGDFEERLLKLVQDAGRDPNLVIFFDEMHTFIGAGASSDALDAGSILKPALARGSIRCIGATTFDEYRRYIEKDPALERRFQPIRVEEPTPEEAREILAGLRFTYEKYHEVVIADEALDAAVLLSVRYITDRRLPDKARDLIDQAAVNKRFMTFSARDAGGEGPPNVTAADIASVIAEWTGIPVERLTAGQQERMGRIGQALRRRVVGQDAALDAVSRVVRTAMAGLSNPNRPLGVFLFIGPTGVGKTELAKALAEFLFDDESRLVRFDMSEFQEKHSVAKLIGSPPGYVGHEEGGRLTDAVRRTPYCVVLFDEIEKAHPNIFDLFLQIFDDGRLTDSRGRLSDFRNTIIILTSNVILGRTTKVGFVWGEETAPADPRIALGSLFRPELINRLSEVVVFQPLSKEHVRAIIDKILDRVSARIRGRRVDLKVSPAAYDALMAMGYRPEFGAREMERVIEHQIVQPLAESILEGKSPKDNMTIYVVARDDGGIALRRSAGDDKAHDNPVVSV